MVQRPHQPDQKIEEGKSRRVSDTFRDYLTDRRTINFYESTGEGENILEIKNDQTMKRKDKGSAMVSQKLIKGI